MDAETSRAVGAHPTRVAPSPADQRHLRDCLGRYATGVTIVTAQAADGSFVGLTVNSFSALSLDPPLVLWSLGDQAASVQAFVQARHFAVSVLAAGQAGLAARFASPLSDRFAGVSLSPGLGGAPLIDGAIAWFECEVRTQARHGDHLLFIGEVRRCARVAGEPLVFHDSAFVTVSPPTAAAGR